MMARCSVIWRNRKQSSAPLRNTFRLQLPMVAATLKDGDEFHKRI